MSAQEVYTGLVLVVPERKLSLVPSLDPTNQEIPQLNIEEKQVALIPESVLALVALTNPNAKNSPRHKNELEIVLGGISLAFESQIAQLNLRNRLNRAKPLGIANDGGGIRISVTGGIVYAVPKGVSSYVSLGMDVRLGNGNVVHDYRYDIPYGDKPMVTGYETRDARAEADTWANNARVIKYGDGKDQDFNQIMSTQQILTGPVSPNSFGRDQNVINYYAGLQSFARILLTVGFRLQR